MKALEAEVARLTGKEAALFVTSGTMANQLAIALQTRPGDEVIVGEGAHVYFYESGAGAALSGVQFAVAGAGGLFDAAAMRERIQPRAHWSARTALVSVEHPRWPGGRVFPQADAEAVAEAARGCGLAVHLDGARLWNASAATGIDVASLAAPFDTVSVCFSKGLGAPAGSALCGSRRLVEEARFFRKRWGGGMRQSGILAAGALFALEPPPRAPARGSLKAAFAEKVAHVPGSRSTSRPGRDEHRQHRPRQARRNGGPKEGGGGGAPREY